MNVANNARRYLGFNSCNGVLAISEVLNQSDPSFSEKVFRPWFPITQPKWVQTGLGDPGEHQPTGAGLPTLRGGTSCHIAKWSSPCQPSSLAPVHTPRSNDLSTGYYPVPTLLITWSSTFMGRLHWGGCQLTVAPILASFDIQGGSDPILTPSATRGTY